MLSEPFKLLFDTAAPASLGPGPRAGTMTEADLRKRLLPSADAVGVAGARRQAALALLLLWHDHLEASHVISQGMDNADGSFVHALMHRREPDYANACYWWRRVGNHPGLRAIGVKARAHLESVARLDLCAVLTPDRSWDPVAFTAACERVETRPPDDAEVVLLCELQRIEFEVLLEHLLTA